MSRVWCSLSFASSTKYLRIAEQNFEDWKWPQGNDYARELRMVTTEGDDGAVRWTVQDKFKILGWMVQQDADPPDPLIPASASLLCGRTLYTFRASGSGVSPLLILSS